MRTSALPLAALSIALASSACAPTADDLDSTVQELNAVSPPFNATTMGVVQVRYGATLCTGVMLDAETVFTAGACNGPNARDYTVQLGGDIQTASQVRFSLSGVALLRLPRLFAGMAPGFTRRVSTRTAGISSTQLSRSLRTAAERSCEMRASVTPRMLPISRSVSSSP